MNKPFIGVGMGVLMFGGVVSANATAITSGDLTMTAGIIYDQNTLDVDYGIDTRTVGGIKNTGKTAHDDSAMYGDQNIAGYDKEINAVSMSYLEVNVNAPSKHSVPMKPASESLVDTSTAGFSGLQMHSSDQVMYCADFTAKDHGTLSFGIDHEGYWTGSKTNVHDDENIYVQLQGRIMQRVFDKNGSYSWSDNHAYTSEYESLWFYAGGSGSIDNFIDRLSLSYDFNAGGGVYNLRFDGSKRVK